MVSTLFKKTLIPLDMLNSREMQPRGPAGGQDTFHLSGLEPQQSALFFETPAEIYARVLRDLKPRTGLPEIQVVFRRYANANSSIRLAEGRLTVKIADILEGAPAPILEALAYILIGKLYRRPIPPIYAHRYRLDRNRRHVRRRRQLVRRIPGRRSASGP